MSARRLATALRAVSTSRPMPRWREYVERVEAMKRASPRTNARAPALAAELRGVVTERPRARSGSTSATELLTALTSFVDDYEAEPPRGPFAVGRAVALLDAFEGRGGLTAPEQLRLALVDDDLLAAVLALHTATRVLARGRDRRLHPRFALTLEERLALGRAIAPFHPGDARGGDPLGDTYHFWANVSAGLFAAGGRRGELRRVLVGAALWSGPVLMTGVRERIFGNRLFYGNHARVDRLGLTIGYTLLAPRRRAAPVG